MDSYYDQKPWLKTYPSWLPDQFTLPPASVLDAFLQSAAAYPDLIKTRSPTPFVTITGQKG
jgi:hypothetical protein